MRMNSDKILLELILEDKKTHIIQRLDNNNRPQSLLGKVVRVGNSVSDVKVGDYVITGINNGECFKDEAGVSFKSLKADLVSMIFDESELEYAKTIKRV